MLPTPANLAAAATNVVAKVFGDGLADLRPMPRVLVDQGPSRSVYRLSGPDAQGPPVLLVPPLAAPALCFDLRRGCSLAEQLIAENRRVYLVDYGTIAFADRGLGIEHWVEYVLPKAIAAVSADAGDEAVHLLAWCLGGIFSLLTAADAPELPVASITAVATPIDFTAIPLVAPIRPLAKVTGGRILTSASRVLGGVPSPVVKWVYQLSGFDKYVTKPVAILSHLDDREFLAQIEAVDRFMDRMIAYPGRTFGQIYHRFFRANDLSGGTVTLGDRPISLADVRVPVLVIAGLDDGIAPKRSVHRLVEVLDGAPEVRYAEFPGGHLGVLTGRRARATTWQEISRFLDEQATVPLTG
ncbi:MAG TPA: alpha/beta hydrolase [Pseudonocardiaceae bacterium]|nr:alpha/beta hydrolase [Pseudonocardiaceae bacterium]